MSSQRQGGASVHGVGSAGAPLMPWPARCALQRAVDARERARPGASGKRTGCSRPGAWHPGSAGPRRPRSATAAARRVAARRACRTRGSRRPRHRAAHGASSSLGPSHSRPRGPACLASTRRARRDRRHRPRLARAARRSCEEAGWHHRGLRCCGRRLTAPPATRSSPQTPAAARLGPSWLWTGRGGVRHTLDAPTEAGAWAGLNEAYRRRACMTYDTACGAMPVWQSVAWRGHRSAAPAAGHA